MVKFNEQLIIAGEGVLMSKRMGFAAWQKRVYAIAAKAKVKHLVPNCNDLFRLWELGINSQDVVEQHCTTGAMLRRHERE